MINLFSLGFEPFASVWEKIKRTFSLESSLLVEGVVNVGGVGLGMGL